VKVSVIIPCRNEVKHISSCIEAIFSSEFKEKIELEVIVVDGKSNDGTVEELLKLQIRFPTLQIITNEKQVTPIAFNLGINASNGDYIQIIGARQIIDKFYLSTAIETFQNDSSVWCVGGQVENIFENRNSKCIAAAMDTPFGVGMNNFRILKKSTYTDTVGTPMYPREVFDKIGLFDESLVRNQDDEFNYRVTKAGGKLFLNVDMHIRYLVRANFKNLFKQYFQYGYWKVFVNKKHKVITTMRQLVPPLWILFLFLGWSSFFIAPILGWIYFSLVSIYVLAGIYYSIKKADPKSDFYILLFTFYILHFSYGLGYLKGILHFFILNIQPNKGAKTLSR
jgi:GT2 family glycosyltransferase